MAASQMMFAQGARNKAGTARAEKFRTHPRPTNFCEDTGWIRDIETTFFDPASVFLSAH